MPYLHGNKKGQWLLLIITFIISNKYAILNYTHIRIYCYKKDFKD